MANNGLEIGQLSQVLPIGDFMYFLFLFAKGETMRRREQAYNLGFILILIYFEKDHTWFFKETYGTELRVSSFQCYSRSFVTDFLPINAFYVKGFTRTTRVWCWVHLLYGEYAFARRSEEQLLQNLHVLVKVYTNKDLQPIHG